MKWPEKNGFASKMAKSANAACREFESQRPHGSPVRVLGEPDVTQIEGRPFELYGVGYVRLADRDQAVPIESIVSISPKGDPK